MNTLFSVCFFFFSFWVFPTHFIKVVLFFCSFFFLAVRTFLSICWRHFIFFYVLCFCYSLSFPRHRYLCSVLIFSVGSCDRWRKILKDKKKKSTRGTWTSHHYTHHVMQLFFFVCLFLSFCCQYYFRLFRSTCMKEKLFRGANLNWNMETLVYRISY